MIKSLLGILIFCIVLFVYLHIQHQFKTSNDLEIYDLEPMSKEKLDDVLDIRQPAFFYWDDMGKITNIANYSTLVNKNGSFDIKIRKVLENNFDNHHNNDNNDNNDNDTDLYIPLTLKAANTLFSQDKKGTYFSEKNSDFLQETGIAKQMTNVDYFLRPTFMSQQICDVLLGSVNSFTPFRNEINNRNFFFVTEGRVVIKIAPPLCKKHLHLLNDYEHLEFRSPINPWSPEPKYAADFDKVKCMEFPLAKGKVFSLPPYWFYSIKFAEPRTSVVRLSYKTYMNHLAILPEIGMHVLQMNNIKKGGAAVLEEEEQEEVKDEPEEQQEQLGKEVNDKEKEEKKDNSL